MTLPAVVGGSIVGGLVLVGLSEMSSQVTAQSPQDFSTQRVSAVNYIMRFV